MFRKSLIASAVSVALFAPVAGAITDDPENHLETRQALEEKGVPTGGATADVESGVFGGMRAAIDSDPTPLGGAVFGALDTADKDIAGTISSLPLPPDTSDTPDIEGALTALSEGDPEGAVAILTGDGGEPDGTATSSLSGSVPVTVTGNVQANLTCNITNSDQVFDFGDVDLTDTTVTSGSVSFTVACTNETVATNIYLSTNDQEPALGSGSNVLVAEFSDGTNPSSDVSLAVQIDSDADGAGDADIGGTTADANTAGDTTAKTINLVALLTTSDIPSASGGTLSEKGTPEIAVWVD